MKGVSDKDAQNNKKIKGDKNNLKKPLQVLHISKKDTISNKEEVFDGHQNSSKEVKTDISAVKPKFIEAPIDEVKESYSNNINFENISYKELEKPLTFQDEDEDFIIERKVDEFDFDESAFLEALNENEPIGATGETIKGKVIALESDGLYIDIGGKAPGFMPKKECGLGVITNFKEKFTIDLEMEVLVIKEQNADGMVTVSARALILRQSWEKVASSAKNGELIQVTINGFNRGGLTCDVDGLRGFIPRSQLENGQDYQSLVSKNLKVAFLEVNPETRKLVLSEKKALLVSKFADLKFGQLIEGEVLAIKPYGFFVDLGGASGLLHQSSITNGSIRNLREIFREGEVIKALITEIDLERGRIGLNTALLENTPGELIIDKEKVMIEASERSLKTKSLFDKKDLEK
ncbi:30S ribosomal protein S1 homolog B, putative Nbp1 [Prochlorococcus marinus subsp. pastoris str. CCMP1986]|uniref:30S ribosomal protein S1 homolog B, putative Nbp1 n=1 Tax=Prochlorococcus marinus subsp. pastoris (strain CCMP1986 / NIES-2087 / MED4) TaxID=59919 RepID=Q7V2F0_PROMP|nr:S1 RNA-binding domain-containing protein [Prochlorococcus marinus]KGF86119.1 SSU ribosomal protein S1p [Prochlorococcus marinus str. EQPAC1]CAE18989.1 30S ribosomal protein S1 homolog B, putative Nbp1 [Prochlorococcus marinus subsp. pastoris str. CCMP1986]